jgi:hypothetical protein
MKEYIGILLLKSTNSITLTSLFDETIVSVIAKNEEEAKVKIQNYGASCEGVYNNRYNEPITTTLVKIIDINDVLRDQVDNTGVRELYSRHFYDIDGYARFESLY